MEFCESRFGNMDDPVDCPAFIPVEKNERCYRCGFWGVSVDGTHGCAHPQPFTNDIENCPWFFENRPEDEDWFSMGLTRSESA